MSLLADIISTMMRLVAMAPWHHVHQSVNSSDWNAALPGLAIIMTPALLQ